MAPHPSTVIRRRAAITRRVNALLYSQIHSHCPCSSASPENRGGPASIKHGRAALDTGEQADDTLPPHPGGETRLVDKANVQAQPAPRAPAHRSSYRPSNKNRKNRTPTCDVHARVPAGAHLHPASSEEEQQRTSCPKSNGHKHTHRQTHNKIQNAS